jgi:hypothetical protein
MENHFSRSSKLTLCVIAFILSLSLSLGTGYGQDFNRKGGLKAQLAERGIDLAQLRSRIREAIQVQNRYKETLMDKSGVVGTATGITPEGEAVVKVFTSRAGIRGIPASLDGVRVRSEVSGKFYALRGETCESSGDNVCTNSERWPLPVPIGVSVGHPAITAGTFGARVTDGASVFMLSNNHVLANINQANLGDPILQPGSFDGGENSDDAVANLSAYEPIDFCATFFIWLICSQTNTIDAAIALSTPGELGFETTMGEFGSAVGYGAPNSTIHPAYGDPDVIGDENLSLLMGQSVQKYGRTTGRTQGEISDINATVDVCYDQACSRVARFADQIIITPGTFSAGGDSGSLIVTNDANNNPVGLLFAGSDTYTIANRIDLVLERFGVTIDSGAPPSLEIISVTPASATLETGQTKQFTAAGYYDDGGTADLTSQAEWTSSDEGVATISDSGLATAIADGTASITATQDGITSNVATLNVTSTPLILESIAVEPTDGTLETGQTQQFTAIGHYAGGGTADLTSSAEWASSDEGVVTISDSGLATGAGEGTASITATFGGIISNIASLTVSGPEPSSGPYLQTGTVTARTDGWTLVTLDNTYTDMVVVCTPNYDKSIYPSAVHMRNASGNSFEVRLVPAVYGLSAFEPPWSANVHWMVVESGVYTVEEHGVKMEAVTFTSTVTDKSGSWVGQNRSYLNSYTNPVVLGQVMTHNADREYYWSVFWSRGSSRSQPPSITQLWVGKHKGQDPRGVNHETIGYVVIEAGEGTISSNSGPIRYKAGLGSDSIRGMGNSPPYSYSLGSLSFTPSTAILSQAAMDGGDGGWAVLYGTNPVTSDWLYLAIEEDWVWDSERRHTTEQVGYIVFE